MKIRGFRSPPLQTLNFQGSLFGSVQFSSVIFIVYCFTSLPIKSRSSAHPESNPFTSIHLLLFSTRHSLFRSFQAPSLVLGEGCTTILTAWRNFKLQAEKWPKLARSLSRSTLQTLYLPPSRPWTQFLQYPRTLLLPLLLANPHVLLVGHDVCEDRTTQEDHMSPPGGIFYPDLELV